jgi:hypothetical protein
MKTGTQIALGIGAFFLLSRQSNGSNASNASTSLEAALLSALQPKPSSSASKGTGAPAGAGGSSTAGRGGDPKPLTGGATDPQSLEDIIPFTDPGGSAIESPGVSPLPTDFLNSPGDLSGVSAIGTTTDPNAVVFGGDPSLQTDSNGLIIDPSTGQPFGSGGAGDDTVGVPPLAQVAGDEQTGDFEF